jgi:hypothetical protein
MLKTLKVVEESISRGDAETRRRGMILSAPVAYDAAGRKRDERD